MLSDRWISRNDVIPIKDYSFNDFKEFLTFLYSGECQLSDGNIINMVDIAEFYQVNSFKKYCDEYLSKITLNMKNIFQLVEISSKYSLFKMKKSIQNFIIKNFTTFVKSKEFLKADKSIIEEIFTIKSLTAFKQEELFRAVYEWAEYQANIKNEFNDENSNKNDAIKNEMKKFLRLIKFKTMEPRFLTEYVVKITNCDGNSIYGFLQNNSTIEIIETLKYRYSDNGWQNIIYWNTKCKKPSTPCPLKKRDGVEWYLIYFDDGDIGVRNSFEIIHRDYLLAEMIAETDFENTPNCEIEIE
uniref:BTB domain-containing protein n=1 Tax=Panagrolaimus davidi TaxID=227884 RepID=A0A914Q8I3_9BILA